MSMAKVSCFAGHVRRPRVMSVAALGFAYGVVAAAAGQGPSISFLPSEPVLSETYPAAISPDGRYVAGFYDGYYGSACNVDELFRWDRRTGSQMHLAVPMDGGYASVLNDGRIFTATASTLALCIETESRVVRWTPEAGDLTYVPRTSNPTTDDFFGKVSRDGLYGIGYTQAGQGAPEFPALFDFTFTTPIRIDLNAGEDSSLAHPSGWYALPVLGGVTVPVNGVRRAFATTVGPDGVLGKTWIVANAQPSTASSEIYDVSPDGTIVLGKIGPNFFVHGSDADRSLPAPISPTILYHPSPRRISDDGRVVVGLAATTPDLLTSFTEAVVWRAGQNPTTLRSILQGAGVTVPAWVGSSISGISADGSTVVGSYYVQAFNPNEFYPKRAFAAVLPALNDNCATARPVTYGTIIDSTNGATRAGVSSGVLCASEGTAPDVWFSFVPAATETVNIDTCGSSFDTTLMVFQTNSCASLGSPIACNDEAANPCAGNVHASRVSVNVFANQNYYIRVSGWNGAFGSVQMTITAPNRPSNDACAQATNLAPGTGDMWNNINAITDARSNCPGTGTPFSDVWYRTVAPESGRMTYSNCSATINTIMTAYDGSACGDPNAIALACGQNNTACGLGVGMSLTVPCTVGQSQLLRIGGLFGATGSGMLVARFACDQNDLSPYSVSVLNSGARAYWRFDDSGSLTAADTVRADPYSCGNFPGNYVGDVPRVSSYHTKALSLNGTGGYVQAEALSAGRFADPAACPRSTLEAWVKTTDPLAGVVVTSRNQPGQHSTTMVVGYNPIGLPNTEGRAMFISDGPGVLYGAMSTVRVDDGRWHHIVGIRAPNAVGGYTHTIYVDGVMQINPLFGPSGNFNGSHGQYWTVGNGLAWPNAGAAFNGLIDDVALYCGELLASQIQDHFTLGNPPPCDSIDFNRDGIYPDVQDITDFISVFSGGACPTGVCGDIDFNNDGLFPDTEDINSFVRVFAGGPC